MSSLESPVPKARVARVLPRRAPPGPSAAREAAPATIERFGKTVRWFHWTFALSFVSLAATGALLALRNTLGIGAAAGHRILTVHEIAAVCLIVLPTVVVLSGDTRDFFRELGGLARWSRDDLRWLALQPLSFLRNIELPPMGKLNAGQKVNGLVMAGLTVALVASGVVLWLRPGSLLPLAIHIACFVLWIPLFAGHLTLALILPGTRPALRGMITGRVPREWARHHHPRWVEALEPPSAGAIELSPSSHTPGMRSPTLQER
jgi:formate dehydrogenase subunit gamma